MFVVWSKIVLIVSMKTETKLASFPKVLWEYWFGWDWAGSETNPDQSPRRDHQSVACIGGNPYTQEQRMFVTGNVPNAVILVCSILHTTNCGKNIRVSNLYYHDGPTSKSSFWLWRGFLFLSLLCLNFSASKGKKPSNKVYILKYLHFVVVLQSNQLNIAASVRLNYHWERLCHQHHPQTMTVQKHTTFNTQCSTFASKTIIIPTE